MLPFEYPERQLGKSVHETGEAIGFIVDAKGGAAYLRLKEVPGSGIDDTWVFGDEESRRAWGTNLDFDSDGAPRVTYTDVNRHPERGPSGAARRGLTS